MTFALNAHPKTHLAIFNNKMGIFFLLNMFSRRSNQEGLIFGDEKLVKTDKNTCNN